MAGKEESKKLEEYQNENYCKRDGESGYRVATGQEMVKENFLKVGEKSGNSILSEGKLTF